MAAPLQWYDVHAGGDGGGGVTGGGGVGGGGASATIVKMSPPESPSNGNRRDVGWVAGARKLMLSFRDGDVDCGPPGDCAVTR